MKTEYQNKVIFRIRKLREKLGFSQSKIATILGLSNGQVGNIETPNQPHKYTLAQIEILCRKFGVPVESVFYDEDTDTSVIPVGDIIHKIIVYQN